MQTKTDYKFSRSLNRKFSGPVRDMTINHRAALSSDKSGRGNIADEALRKFSWESGSDPTE